MLYGDTRTGFYTVFYNVADTRENQLSTRSVQTNSEKTPFEKPTHFSTFAEKFNAFQRSHCIRRHLEAKTDDESGAKGRR